MIPRRGPRSAIAATGGDAAGMRILFLSHYFFPEGNAPATRVHELGRRWARMGHDVTVVTCAPNVPSGVVYPGYANHAYRRERVDGIDVRRVWTFLAANAGSGRRIANYLSFLLAGGLAGLCARRPDVVIATSPQFFCGWAGVIVSTLRAGRRSCSRSWTCGPIRSRRSARCATLALAADPALARRLGDAGYERIATRYTYDRLAQNYANLLARLIGGDRR